MSERREILVGKALRAVVLVMTALTLVAIVIGMLPGHEVYENGILVERRAAGGAGFSMFACWLVAPGLVVWLHPRLRFALMWTTLAWIGGVMLVGASMSFDFSFDRTYVQLWPSTAMHYVMVPVLVTILIGIPIAALIYRIAAHLADEKARRLVTPEAPVARIHREKITPRV
jgi:hypothetical protein